jgi:hypothetical protein
MFTTKTGRLVKVAEEMNRTAAELDVALRPDVRAGRVLNAPRLHDRLDELGRMIRPLTS